MVRVISEAGVRNPVLLLPTAGTLCRRPIDVMVVERGLMTGFEFECVSLPFSLSLSVFALRR